MIDIRATAPPPVRSFYPYSPSQAAAGVLCGLFSISFVLSFWQTVRHKAWIWFIMVFAIGSRRTPQVIRGVSVT